jgi:sigma-E factor negative regulatory protein RseC
VREEGIVVEVKGPAASVKMVPRGGCGTCRVCATGEAGARYVDAENQVGARPGERVVVEISDARQLRAACMVYLLPLIAFLGGYCASAAVIHSEAAALCFGGAAVSCVVLFLRRYDRRISQRGRFWHRIVKTVDTGGAK